jgi:glyoxylase-like metal-dependent hydrolase (beta-lactamase superfamily II)
VEIATFVVGPLQSNSYLVVDESSRRAAVIDPGMDSEVVLDAVRRQGLRVESVVITHGHFDHVFSGALFKTATGAAVVMHPNDLSLLAEVPETARLFGIKAPAPPSPDRLVREGDTIAVGGLSLRVLETPGHTPGSISLCLDDAVFVGDTLFAGSVGRTDLTGGSLEVLLQSIHTKLLALPDRTVVYAGHGPATSIGVERRDNPFLQSGGR